jgi:hypothetical protein
MVEAIDQVTADLRPLLVVLTRYYPAGHFGTDARAFIDSTVQSRGRWYWLVTQPQGIGLSGTMHRIDMALTYRSIVENMIEDMIRSLVGDDPDFSLGLWQAAWHEEFSVRAAPN